MRCALLSLLPLSLALACELPQNPPPGPGPRPPDPCARSLDEGSEGVELYRFEATDPFVTVHIEREHTGAGVGESALYELRSFALGQGDACVETREEAALAYENTHHNWADRASAEIEGVRYTLVLDYVFDEQGASWRFTVSGADASTGDAAFDERALQVTGAPLACWACPGHLPVWLTEVLPENDGATRDEANDADPWLELWNPSGDAVDLEGWTLALSGAESGTWTFPAGTSIARHGHLVVWLDGEPEEGDLHTSFALPTEGGALALYDENGAGAGERSFDSPGAGKSVELDIYTRVYVESEAPTPGETSARQE